jgi:hypothetical protein
MRAGIGLLSLLVVAAIIFYVAFGGKQGGYVGTVMKAGKEGQEQSSQISGRTDDGTPIQDTIKLDEVDVGGEFRRLKVISIIPGTPMDTAYGLLPNDEITKVGGMGVRDNNDAGLAKALVYEAYQRNEPLTIMRKDVEMTLTPNTSLTKMHPNLFGKPGATVDPNAVSTPQAVPSH